MMEDTSTQLQDRENSIGEQDKLRVLTGDFGRLEDSQKDYILDLTRKLVGIHCGGEYGGAVIQKAVSPFQI